MAERPDYNKQFEEHPDIQSLQGPQGRFHESIQGKLDLFEMTPAFNLADVPVGGTLSIRSLSYEGTEEQVRFRRLSDREDVGGAEWEKWHYVLLGEDGGVVEGARVNMFGACASPWGTLLEAGDTINVRQNAYFAYAVVYPVRFRHGSEVPGTPYVHYKTPEEQLDPQVLAQYLAAGKYILRDEEGRLYWDEIDTSRAGAGEYITGQVVGVEVILDQEK